MGAPRISRLVYGSAEAFPGLGRFVVLAAIAGTATGLMGGAFRLLLTAAESLRDEVLERAGNQPGPAWLVPMAVGFLCAAAARASVRWVPQAAGSGVQRLEAEARGEQGPAPLSLLPAKFVGGLLALGSGLALGREGPTVQMGAAVAAGVGRFGRADPGEVRDMAIASGGAGLAVAFSAPLGGILFAVEEVAQRFRPRLLVIALVATGTAMIVAQQLLGAEPNFSVSSPEPLTGPVMAVVVVLGLLCGVLGLAYNRLVLSSLTVVAGVQRRLPPEIVAGAVGVVVVVVGLLSPDLIGGGDPISQSVLDGDTPLRVLVALLLIRFLLGPMSYSVGTPGGLFSPLLAIGALLGGIVAGVSNAVLPGSPVSSTSLAIVGMATFFTAVVRAPLTGIALIVEMTATTTLVLPMVLAAAGATIVCMALRGQPVYDSLRLLTEADDRIRIEHAR